MRRVRSSAWSPLTTCWTRSVMRAGTLFGALLLAGLLCVSGCGVASHIGTALPASGTPPVATPGVPAASPLVWTSARMPASQLPALPGGFDRQGPTAGVAPSNGSTAYVCAPTDDASHMSVATWLTGNRGASWQQGGGITVDIGRPIEVTGCQIVVDATEAGTAVAQISFLPAGGCFPAVDCDSYALYLSTDRGQHWTLLPPLPNPDKLSGLSQPLETLSALATYQQTSYALFGSAPRDASVQTVSFVMSRDNLRTWTPVPGLANVNGITAFWLNPSNGALLIMTTTHYIDQETFLTSFNGGESWTSVPSPPFPFAIYDIVVQQPFTNQPWRICGGDTGSFSIDGVQQNTHMDDVACTADGGAHWQTHRLSLPANGVQGPGGAPYYTLVGIADDGTLLLFVPDAGYDLPELPGELERVVSGVPGVQALGKAPNGGLMTYSAGGGKGVLWFAPQGGYTDPDPQGRIFTASYA